ncbi:MAG: iron ABC transporter permease [Lentisphaeria bacterium]|jgi:iron(III) transport system permease protein
MNAGCQRLLRRHLAAFLLGPPLALFFGVFLLYPLFEVLRGGLVDEAGRPTAAYLAEVFRNPLYLEGFLNATALALWSTLAALLLALPLAFVADRYEFPGKRLLGAGILLPMILPPFVGALGMQKLLGQYGVLNVVLDRLGLATLARAPDWLGGGGFWAIVAVQALHLYPIIYLNAAAAFANVDPTLHEAAANLGCTGLRRFRRITLPLIMPGLFAGCILVFIWSLSELGTPLMFNFNRVTAVQIFNGILEIGDNPFPYALVLVTLTATAGLYLLARLTLGRQAHAMAAKAGSAARPTPLHGTHAAAAAGLFATVTALSVLPHLAVLGLCLADGWQRTLLPLRWTLDHLQAALGHATTVPSILNSLKYSSLAVLLAMVVGTLVAWIGCRGRWRFAWLLDALAMLPLAVPGLVLAFGYLAMTQKGRPLGFLDPVAASVNATTLLAIAYAVRRLPYVVRAAAAGLQQTSVSLEEAAANLGAGPAAVFRRIVVPLIAANLLAGALLAFSFSMLEVSDSLMLAQKATDFPITKALYELSMLLGEGPALAAALGVWTMLFLGLSLLAANQLLGKKLGALFRA